jgi:hypothetical protein
MLRMFHACAQVINGSLFDGSSSAGTAIYQNAQGGSYNQNAAGK